MHTTTMSDDPHPSNGASTHAGDGVPDILALLDEWSRELRRLTEPIMSPHTIDELRERVAFQNAARREHLDRTTDAQRTAGGRLLAEGLEAAALKDLVALRRSLATAIEIVATWPGDELPAMERIALRYSDCDLSELARPCCHAFEPLVRERHLSFHTELPDSLMVRIDPSMVQRVILNLLFNAFKLTPIGGSITFRMERDDRLDEAVITVVDSGRGIPPGHEQTIFSRHRLSDRTGSTDGLGFDLGASRDFLSLHGGTLRTVPTDETGAHFRGCLPLHPPCYTPLDPTAKADDELPEQVAATASEELMVEARLGELEPVPDDRPLVLIVEDSRVMQRMLSNALPAEATTVAALDGATGLRLTEELRPDLIITDLGLPAMGGREMIRAIRSRPQLEDIPILVVTGHYDPAQTAALLREQVQDVLRKPFLAPELRARAQNLLEAKRARDVLGNLLGQQKSDLVRLADEVTRHQRHLESALDEVRVARELAESASRVKSNFLRMMSHELKTPVTALLLQQQVLSGDRFLADPPKSVQRSMHGMSRSVSRMLHIVDTMLEWARVESGRCRLEPQAFDLREAVRNAAAQLRQRAEVHGVAIDVRTIAGDDWTITSDRRIVELIFINMIGRAISLTDDTVVTVDVTCTRDEHRVRVTDGGPALTALDRAHLFNALAADVDVARSGGVGSGLGLHVVRDLARALGGELCLAADCDSGNTIELILDNLDVDPQPRPSPNSREETHAHELPRHGAGEGARDDPGKSSAHDTGRR